MARTIAEIKQQMADTFMADSAVQDKYGFAAGEHFDYHFSKVSIENLVFHIVAVAVWTLEKIIDTHRAAVDEQLLTRQPCTARWYRDQILALRDPHGDPVCTACAIDTDSAIMLLKLQCGTPGNLQPLTGAQLNVVREFLYDNHPPGILYEIRTTTPDLLSGTVTYYYDPQQLDPADNAVRNTLVDFLANLPYDGILAESDLQAALLAIPGVRRVKLATMRTKQAGGAYTPLGLQRNTFSGSWAIDDSAFLIQAQPYTNADIA